MICNQGQKQGGTLKLYRGFSAKLKGGVHANPFVSSPRLPVDTPPGIHEYADDWFEAKFGVKARSTTIICSTDLAQARQYGVSGTIGEIVPIGSFSVIFSTDLRDFLNSVFELADITERSVSDWLESKRYQCIESLDGIPQWFRGEVMLSCDSYKLVVR